jgi:hypothetical protein
MAPPNSVHVASTMWPIWERRRLINTSQARRRAQLKTDCRIELRLDRSEIATRRIRVLSGQPPAPERF